MKHYFNHPEHLEARLLFALATGDFDGDGRDDLAIGVLAEDLFGGTPAEITSAGAVNVIYGTRNGLASRDNQFWHLDSPGVKGSARELDRFAAKLTTGDFDNDGFDDLAIGIIGFAVGDKSNAGAVLILYGSEDGLSADRDQLLTMDSPGVPGKAQTQAFFGSSLVAGDFDGDGFDELGISAVGRTVNGKTFAGAITILRGSSDGITTNEAQFWSKDTTGVNGVARAGDFFGESMVAGDFDNNGRDDLAAGSYYEYVDGKAIAGAVHVLYGRKNGLKAKGDQLFSQDTPGVAGHAEQFAYFAHSLAVADFDNDGFDDLAISKLAESLNAVVTANIALLHGSEDRLFGEEKAIEAPPFPNSIAGGDFNNDGYGDLAIGNPLETAGLAEDAGVVTVAYGNPNGIENSALAILSQQTDAGSAPEAGDGLGELVTTGDFDGDGRDDVAASAPFDDLDPGNTVNAHGGVLVLYGFIPGLITHAAQLWTQASSGILDSADIDDFLGLRFEFE